MNDETIVAEPICETPDVSGAAAASLVALESDSGRPLLVIQPKRGWSALDLGEIWAHRELLYFLTLRDIKLRYKQTMLGAIWAILQPLLPMVIFTLFFGRLAGMPSDGIPYSIFAYAALLPWTYFANAVSNSSVSVVGNSTLVSKVYFPRMIIPGAATLAALLDFLVGLIMLGVLMLWHHVSLHLSILMFPALVALTTALALGIGLLFSAWNVRYRDIRYALPFVVQFWMFATPVIYPASLVPHKWRWALALNPLTGVIEGFRSALFGRPFDWTSLAFSSGIAIMLLFYAGFAFRRMERTFADTI